MLCRTVRNVPYNIIPCTVSYHTMYRIIPYLITAPMRKPSLSKSISMNFPNLDELSFLTVRALPNASKIGLLCKTCGLHSNSEENEKADEHSFRWHFFPG